MPTKGPSNRYGNSRGGRKGHPTMHTNFEFAKSFMPSDLVGHYERHGAEFGATSQDDYVNRSIKFANYVDRKNCKSIVDNNGTTYKYNTKTRELVIVTKNGIVVSYYKISYKQNGFYYTNRRGKETWKNI